MWCYVVCDPYQTTTRRGSILLWLLHTPRSCTMAMTPNSPSDAEVEDKTKVVVDSWENTKKAAKDAGDAIVRVASPVGDAITKASTPALKAMASGRDSIVKSLGFKAVEPEPEPEPETTTLAEANPLAEIFAKVVGGFCIPCQAAKAAPAA